MSRTGRSSRRRPRNERSAMPWLAILILLLLVAIIAAVKFLDWWVLLIIVAVLVFGWRYIGELILLIAVRRVARDLMGALRGATVEVHEVLAVPVPTAAELEQ